MKTNYLLLFILLLLTGLVTQCHNPINENDIDLENENDKNKGIVYGINRVNLQWKNDAEVEKIATNIDTCLGVPLVRIGGVKKGGSISQVIRNINTFHEKGIQLLLEQPMWLEMFPEGYELVPGISWPFYKMSDIDTTRFRTFMGNLFSAIKTQTDQEAVVAIELFNEANWAGFNSDLQPLETGKGEVFDMNTPLDYPTFVDAYHGIEKYGQCLKITRKLIDEYFPLSDVKLISNGLVLDGAHNNYQWARNHGYTLVTPKMFLTLLQGQHPDQSDSSNYLKFVDAIGIHCYPILTENMTDFISTNYFDPLNSVLVSQKKYWITEWGFDRGQFANIGGEKTRLRYINYFIDAIETIPNIEATTFYEFDLSTNHNIWENGKLLESGTFFKQLK